MPSTWVLHGFRSALLHENLMLLVLMLVEDSEKSEWELLDSLYSHYKLTPIGKEFRRLLETLVEGGYATFTPAEGTRRLRITTNGMKLLRSLQSEYRAIVSNIDQGESSRPATS